MASIIRMPEVLADMTEAVLSSWEVTSGATINVGDVLAEIETEKAQVEYAAEEAGVLGDLLAQPGDTVSVGAPIAVLLSHEGEDVDLTALLGDGGAAPGGSAEETEGQAPEVPAEESADIAAPRPPQTSAIPASESTADGTAATSGRIFASPLARRIAKERGIDLADLRGSGPHGRILRKNVEEYEAVQQQVPEPPPAVDSAPTTGPGTSAVEEVSHSPMRRAIARRLTESKSTVPHFYLTADCRVDALLDLRRQINGARTTKISVNDFVIKAVAAAFESVPEANVIWTETALRRFSTVDVSVAVATSEGLVTPIVRGVESASLSAVSRQVSDLVERARNRRLRQEELEGGTFTVSNLGMYGTREFSAILNPPQSGILAVGAAMEQPVAINGELAVATVMRCTLSADHRAVDGELAARWLTAFQQAIENPLLVI